MAAKKPDAEETQALAEALAFEAELVKEADKAWAEDDNNGQLSWNLWATLYPLLCKPIPSGFIEHVGAVSGKPYDSTGIRSVQVQVDRMNGILKPQNWVEECEYSQEGKLAKVTVGVKIDGQVVVSRWSMGGVNQASTIGNYYKGSYTNAAKIAFARLGIGHEVYVGAADLDPDTNQKIAKEQTDRPQQRSVAPEPEVLNERVDALMRLYKDLYGRSQPDEKFKLFLGSLGVTKVSSVMQAFGQLTQEKAEQVELWLSEKIDFMEESKNANDQ